MTSSQSGSATRTTLFVLLGISAFLAVAVMLLPKGFSDDLSKIGAGMAVAVLIHDKGSTRSLDLMELLNKVRPDYTGKVEFIVTDIVSKEGQMFSQRHDTSAIVVIFFSPDGTKQGKLENNMSEAALRLRLDMLAR